MRKIFLLAAFIILTQAVFAQENNENTNVSVDQAKENSKGILKELFMFKMAADVLETRALISDNELGDSIENHMANYDNALFFKSTMEYDFFWNKVLGRKKYKVPSSKMFLDSKDKYLEKNEVGTSIDFDIVLTPQWENPATQDKLKDYTIKITPDNYTGLAFTSEQKEQFSTTLNSELAETYTTPKNAEVNKAVFAGLAELRALLGEAQKPVNINLGISFKSYNQQKYGFDDLTYDVHKPTYETKKYNGNELVLPWKSLESSSVDQVLVEISDNDDSYSPEDVKFKTATGTNLTATKFEGNDNIRLLNLNGKTNEVKEEIIAYVDYKIDENTNKQVELAGLNTISYDKLNINIVLVPVNGNAPFSVEDFTSKLNAIYKQAVIDWKVTLDQPYTIAKEEWDKDNDGKLNDGESTFLSNYSDEQKAFKNKYKQDRGRDKNTYYVFLLNNIASKSGLAGYMPLKEQYAFIHSVTSENAAQLIAHELGHGAFRLWHTFSPNSSFFMAEKSSDNLMDYNKGERLHKYQWHKVHNPDGGFYMFQDEDEGAAYGEGPGGSCLSEQAIIEQLNEKYQQFYLPNGKVLDTEGKFLVSGFFSYSDEEPEESRGTVFSIRTGGYDYTHLYTSSKETFGFGLKINESQRSAIKIEKLKVLEESSNAVKVLIDKTNHEIKIFKNGEQVGEPIKFTEDCACSKFDPSTDLYFAFDQNTSKYVDFALENAIKVVHEFHEDQDLIDAFLPLISEQKSTNAKDEDFLGEILADKLKTYEIFNNRKFIVVPVEVNSLSLNQNSWNQLAQKLFEKAQLSSRDILVTIPYVQCKGIGGDLGEYYFMPGLAYGDEINIDVTKLDDSYVNTQRVANFAAGYINPIENFIVDVFRHTSKKLLIYKAVFNASNTIECVVIRKDNISGEAFNKTIRLKKQTAVDELAQIIVYQNNAIKQREQELSDFLATPSSGPQRFIAVRSMKNRIKEVKVTHAEERLNFIKEHAEDNNITDFSTKYYNLRIREEFLEETFEHERIKKLDLEHTFALAYIYTDAFNDVRKELEYAYEDLSSGDWNGDWTFDSKTDYILQQYDQNIYNTLDGVSIALGYFGLDFIADGLGLGYSLFRGDVVQAGGFATGILVVGPESVVAVKATTSALVTLFIKNTGEEVTENVGKRVLLELAQKYANDGTISKEVFDGLQNLEEKDLANVLKAAIKGKIYPSQLPFVSQLDNEVINIINNWDNEIILTLEYDLSANSTFTQSFVEMVKSNPTLVESWKLLAHRSSGLRTNTDALEAVSRIRSNPKYADVGLDDNLLGQLKGWGYGTDNGASFAEIITDLDRLLTNIGTNNITVTNFDKITDVLKASNNANKKGTHWIIQNLADDVTTFNSKSITLEFTVPNARNTNSYLDVYCADCFTGGKRLLVEYKYGPTSVTKDKIIEQFIERDLFNPNITSINQIQWRLKETGLTKTQLNTWLNTTDCKTAIENLGVDKIAELLDDVSILDLTDAQAVDRLINYLSIDANYNLIFR